MRLMIVADSLSGGLGAVALEHARFMGSSMEVTVLAPHSDSHLAPHDVEVKFMDLPMSFTHRATPRAIKVMRRTLSTLRPDLVHVHGVRSFFIVRMAGAPAWVTMHGFGSPPGVPLWQRAMQSLARSIAPRLAIRAYSVSPGAPHGWHFLPHASPRLAELTASQPGENLEFAWVGRLAPPKRPQLFVSAIAKLRGRASGVIYGDGTLRGQVESLIKQLDAPVRMAGTVPDVMEAIRSARAVVTLSHFEGVPFSVQEAMWSGRPVIVSRLPGNEWLVGHAGLYADTEQEVLTAMTRLLDRDFATQLGAFAAQQMRQRLTPSDPWPTLRTLYERT